MGSFHTGVPATQAVGTETRAEAEAQDRLGVARFVSRGRRLHCRRQVYQTYLGRGGQMPPHLVKRANELRWAEQPGRRSGNRNVNSGGSGFELDPKLTFESFIATPFKLEWSVQDILVRGETAVIAGAKKTLKTKLAMDQA